MQRVAMWRHRKIESVTRIRVCEDAVHAVQPGNKKSLGQLPCLLTLVKRIPGKGGGGRRGVRVRVLRVSDCSSVR